MPNTQTTLVTIIFLLCGVTVVGTAGMLLYEAVHPLADTPYPFLWLIYSLPYVTAASMAWYIRRSPGLLAVVLLLTLCAALVGSRGRYLQMEQALRFLEARAAGRRLMSCGPPPATLTIPVEYCLVGVAFLTVVVRLALCPPTPAGHRHNAVRDG